MKKRLHRLIVIAAITVIVVAYAFDFKKPFYIGNSERFEPLTVEAEQSEICQGGILFYGSSSIRGWKQTETTRFDIANVDMVGLGGAMLNDLVYYYQRIVVPRNPSALFVYAGENDVGARVWSNTIVDELNSLLDLVEQFNPNTQVYFLSIKPSPKRAGEYAEQVKVNGLIRAFAENTDNLQFIDVSSVLFDGDQLNTNLFHQDGIHLSHAGYEAWTKVLSPTVNNIETATCF